MKNQITTLRNSVQHHVICFARVQKQLLVLVFAIGINLRITDLINLGIEVIISCKRAIYCSDEDGDVDDGKSSLLNNDGNNCVA